MSASRFFSSELPRRAIFQEIEDAGLQVVAYGCRVRPLADMYGTDMGSGYHKYFIVFASDAQAVQFKLSYL